ncbi:MULTISPECIES: hypothetical protein [unclassified Clostridium]|uniref:hypothetical protein n=1 Tax=unclassified Clostridium TaxID=2614128 RepID=UPI0025B9D266|nr:MULTISPECIES: hypothetical protein [unclassified Clostridium]
MGFTKIILKYGTFKDKCNLIKELITGRYPKEKVKIEYLALMFLRMSVLILDTAWALEINLKIKDMKYIDEFASYLVEIKDLGVFKGDNEERFMEFRKVYAEYYLNFLKLYGMSVTEEELSHIIMMFI